MSTIADFAFLARSKLHYSLASGSRDNLSLHRWVLLKNSINRDDLSTSTISNSSSFNDTPEPEAEEEADEEVGNIDEDNMFSFLFPDPGDAESEDDGSASEAQWLDSLLETLGDDGDDDLDSKMPAVTVDDEEHFQIESDSSSSSFAEYSQTDTGSPLISFKDGFASPHRIAVPYPVPYPPYRPSLVNSFDLDSPPDLCCPYPRRGNSPPYHDIDDLSMPDTVEDSSDDESDSPTTPFTRSRTSLNLVDPASVPLPHERRPPARREPHIYTAADEFFSFEVDPLPYPDMDPDSTTAQVYTPFHQSC